LFFDFGLDQYDSLHRIVVGIEAAVTGPRESNGNQALWCILTIRIMIGIERRLSDVTI
jgi:hypothetical protein